MQKEGIEGKDYVVCQICGFEFRQITHKHLKKHGLTLDEYRSMYPDVVIKSECTLKKHRDSHDDIGSKLWIAEHQGKHFCHCGCGREIEIKPQHHEPKVGIPEYLPGHKSIESQAELTKLATGVIPSQQTKDKMRESHIGLTHTLESIDKMRGLHAGDKNGMYGKTGDQDPFYGKKHSLETKIVLSCKRQGIDINDFDGFVSSWQTEFYNSNEYREWRDSVYKRDNYTCQKCGAKGKYLNAHHIYPIRDYPDPQYSLNILNGITLCRKCHGECTSKEYDFAPEFFNITIGGDS